MNSKTIGERTEAIILAELLRNNFTVLLPFGDNQRYDLVIDDRNGKFSRIQCKTGHFKNGAIYFPTCSYYHNEKRDYQGQVEYFGVYCPKIKKVYLISVKDVGLREGALRINPPANNQIKNIRWAKDYELQSEDIIKE